MNRKKKSNQPTPARDLYAELSARLPDEAYEPIPGTSFTGIKDAYVEERLNRVHGPAGWSKSKPEMISCSQWCDIEGKVFCDANGAEIWEATSALAVHIEAFKKTYHGKGGSRNTDKENAIKDSVTDAFGNAIKGLIGIEVYKGMIDPQNLPQTAHYSTQDANGTATARTGPFLWHSGVLLCWEWEQKEGFNRLWFKAGDVLCFCDDPHEAEKIEGASIMAKISFHALREYPKRGFPILKCTSVLQIKDYEPIVIPELKGDIKKVAAAKEDEE